MSGYWPSVDSSLVSTAPQQWASGPPTGIAENMAAAFDDTLHTQTSVGMTTDYGEAYADRINDIYKTTGQKLENPVWAAQMAQSPASRLLHLDFGSDTSILNDKVNAFEQQVDTLRKQYPQLQTEQDMLNGLAANAKNYEQTAGDISSRATWLGKVGGFMGNTAASMSEPVNLLTLPFFAPASAGILRAGVKNYLLQSGATGIEQPEVQALREKFGLQGGFKQGLENTLEAGIGAGGFTAAEGVLTKAVGAGIKMLPDGGRIVSNAANAVSDKLMNVAGKPLVNLFDKVVKSPTPEEQLARDAQAHIADVNSMSPLDMTQPGAMEEHNARLTEMMNALQQDRAPQMPETPAAPLAQKTLTTPQVPAGISTFNPRDIQTDAKTFQFKEGGDASGVTDRLQGVQNWDPVKGGQVIVYENNAGDRFIADGHQRLGLAQRILAGNPDADITLYGPLFREADGYSPESVRAIAAMKNIAEGTGSAVDAAKAMRVNPDLISELPQASQLVRQGVALKNLTDNSFGMVINDVVPANQAAIVGRLVHDPKMQDAIMNVLAKVEPENAQQAEAVVRQAMDAGTKTETQASLFGEEAVTSSLYLERAKVLDKTLKKLKSERKVFQTLVDNSSRIEQEGNKLNAAQNAARAETDGRAAQMIQVLANRKGPLSDALTAAARRAADEGKFTNATSDFVAAVRSAAERGDFNGIGAGEAERPVEFAPQDGAGAGHAAETAPDTQSLKLFDEPGGDGSRQQARALEADVKREAGIDKTAAGDQRVIPGAEQKSLQDVADHKAGEKIKPTAPQQDANDGLFDVAGRGQSDLLDQQIPVGETFDAEGNAVPVTKSVKEIMDEIDQDQKDLDAIGKCGLP